MIFSFAPTTPKEKAAKAKAVALEKEKLAKQKAKEKAAKDKAKAKPVSKPKAVNNDASTDETVMSITDAIGITMIDAAGDN